MATTILKELVGAGGQFRNREFASADERAEYAAYEKALNEEARQNWTSESWHREQAELIAESLDYGFKNEAVFNQFIATQQVGFTDKITVRERRGLEVFYTHRAGEIDESQLRDDVWELPRDTLGWHVSEFEEDILANYGDTISQLIPLAKMREEVEVNRRIFNLVKEAVPTSSPFYVDATTALTAAALNTAVAEVQDVPPPSNGGSISRPVTIVGRAAALNQIFDLPGYAPEAQEELRKTGRLGVYRGANVVKLTNWVDEDGASFVDDDELYVLGGHIGRFGFYGGARVKSWTEHKVDFRHYQSRRDLGGAIWRPEAIRRIGL